MSSTTSRARAQLETIQRHLGHADVSSFEAHLKATADDDEARGHRAAERATLLARLPVLATEIERLTNAYAAGGLDDLLDGIKARKQERVAAEARISELEGVEMDLPGGHSCGRATEGTLGSWYGVLSDPSQMVLARQILRRVLMDVRVQVRPLGDRASRSWSYVGIGRYDGIIHGTVARPRFAPVPDVTLVRTPSGPPM